MESGGLNTGQIDTTAAHSQPCKYAFLFSMPDTKLAMVGMLSGNGHPWSWSGIINGYELEALKRCPYARIREYMGARDPATVGIAGAKVTHLWTDNPGDAQLIAAAALIPNVVGSPEEVIGQVDAVIVPTDDGDDHVRRVRPFVEAGLPVFVDKPLATNLDDLAQFVVWRVRGAKIISTSGLRYAVEFQALKQSLPKLGELRWVTSFTENGWERYGIHALEAAGVLLGPGFVSVRTTPLEGGDIVDVTHRSGAALTLAAIHDAGGSFGVVRAYGTKGHDGVQFVDSYSAFREQLLEFVRAVQTGRESRPFAWTVEQMLVIIAGIESRKQQGKEVRLSTLREDLRQRLSRHGIPVDTAASWFDA